MIFLEEKIVSLFIIGVTEQSECWTWRNNIYLYLFRGKFIWQISIVFLCYLIVSRISFFEFVFLKFVFRNSLLFFCIEKLSVSSFRISLIYVNTICYFMKSGFEMLIEIQKWKNICFINNVGYKFNNNNIIYFSTQCKVYKKVVYMQVH